VIKYLGSKRVLLPRIVAAAQALPGARTALDLFSGTSRVGHALKRTGLHVTANDHLHFAHALARCYVEADALRWRDEAERLIDDLADAPSEDGWFTETYCRRSRYFQPANGARIEGIRRRIAALGLPADLEAIALTSLLEAADRVDSTVGVQMAYLKSWSDRSHQPLELRVPEILAGGGLARCEEAASVARSGRWDIAYLDPPYNQHRYGGNYHVWETLVRWDDPEVYGVACKRIDCRAPASPFNLAAGIEPAMREVLEALDARLIVVSYSDEGRLHRDTLEATLKARGHVQTVAVPFRRYIGSQIGIFNPAGAKVGTPGRQHNREYLFCVSEDARVAERAAQAVAAAG
jgi:adenine-specific DNA-methyltransferase